MNHLIAAPLFFSLGALLSWLFFAWKGDRDESKLCKKIEELMEENELLYLQHDVDMGKLNDEICRNIDLQEIMKIKQEKGA